MALVLLAARTFGWLVRRTSTQACVTCKNNPMKARVFEWLGVVTAIVYSLLVAANIGAEFIGFTLLLTSSALIGIWAYLGKHKGILFLQFFYAAAGIIGMIRWF